MARTLIDIPRALLDELTAECAIMEREKGIPVKRAPLIRLALTEWLAWRRQEAPRTTPRPADTKPR